MEDEVIVAEESRMKTKEDYKKSSKVDEGARLSK